MHDAPVTLRKDPSQRGGFLRFILTSDCRAPGPRHRPDPKELLATGEAIKIKAGKKIAFRASKDLKEAVM